MTSASIYDQHSAAFRHVSAYVVVDPAGERVATVAFKSAASNCRTTCWLHIMGTRMVKAHANGGGYNKHDASIAYAARKVTGEPTGYSRNAQLLAIRDLISHDDGSSWQAHLERAGYKVLQAV